MGVQGVRPPAKYTPKAFTWHPRGTFRAIQGVPPVCTVGWEEHMRVLVLVKATAESESGALPPDDLLIEMGNFNDELLDAGVLLAGEGLHPSSDGKRVMFDGTQRTVVDGPFDPPESLVAGFWLWQVKDMDEAIAWVKRCPNPMRERSEIEIRPLYEIKELGDAVPPKVAEQERRQRERLAERK